MESLACRGRRLWRSFPSLFTVAEVLASVAAEGGQFESITVADPGRVVLTLRLPAGHYAVIHEADEAGEAFRPVRIVRHPGTPSLTVELPVTGSAASSLWRFEAIPETSPVDTDGDGMDDLFELWRAQVLDPLNASDAAGDADWDGISNLDEYRAGLEPAPPPAFAPLFFPSLTALRARALLPFAGAVRIDGYDGKDDGWGGTFFWDAADGEAPDDALVVQLPGSGVGRLRRFVDLEDSLQANWWRPPTDGREDAGPALQRALAALTQSPVRQLTIGPGRYRVEAVPALHSADEAPLHVEGLTDFIIEGTDATIVTDRDGDMLTFRDCARGVVRGLSFEGSGSDRAFPAHNFACVGLWGACADLVFERCQFRHFMHGISHLRGEKTSKRVAVRECYFEDGGDTRHALLDVDGAAISGVGSDWTIEHNTIHECARGIELENHGLLEPIERVLIQGNRLTNVRNLGIMAFMGEVDRGRIQQSANVIRDNVILGRESRWRRADGSIIPVMGIWLLGGDRWLIQSNHCEIGDYAGISLYAAQADITDSIVQDNTVVNLLGRGIQVVSAQPFTAWSVVVTNNRVRSCGDSGLLLGGENLIAVGNSIDATGSAGITVAPAASAASGPVQGIDVVGNLVVAPQWPNPAILVAAGTEDVRVEGNDLRDAVLGVQVFGQNVSVAGNTLTLLDRTLDEPSGSPELPPTPEPPPAPVPDTEDPKPPGERPPLDP